MDGESAGDAPRASPWPVFVAVGLALSEVGVVLGVEPVAVGGVALFAASVAGVLHESRYAATLRRPAVGVGAAFAAAGTLLYAVTGADARGVAVAVGGAVVAGGGVALAVARSRRP